MAKRDIIDEADAELQQLRSAVPIQYRVGATQEVVGQNALVQQPNRDQIRLFSQARLRTCGDCKHFKKEALQSEKNVKRGFLGMIWEEWGKGGHRYLGDRPDRLGRCAQDAGLAVGPSSLGCSHFKSKG